MISRVVSIHILAAFLIGMFVTGCSSTSAVDRQDILAELLREIDVSESSSSVGSSSGTRTVYGRNDGPDRPVSGLPSPEGFNSAGNISAPKAPERAVVGSHTSERQKAAFGAAGLTIQPDSIVQISVGEDVSLDGSYPVNEIGAVELGYVGPVILLNKTESSAAEKISEVLVAREFRKATVHVKILRASYDKVRISGAVEKAGLVRIGAGDSISLNNALLRAGGIKASAKGAKIRIIRDGLLSAVGHELPGEEYSLVNAAGEPVVPNVMLNNNDVARVFSSEAKAVDAGGDKEILVVGEVNKPGLYRFVSGESCTIMHLVFKMGGLPLYANKKAIVIKRKNDDGTEEEIKVNAQDIMKEGDPEDDIPLENGDRVVVPARRLSLF